MWENLTGGGPTPSPETLGAELWAWFQGLPQDYREFPGRHNGGRAANGGYTFRVDIPYRGERSRSSAIEVGVESFLPLRAKGEKRSPDDLVEWNAYIHEMGSVPRDAVAIADCAGSLVCLSLRPEEFGAVYYWEYYAEYPWHEEFFRELRGKVMRKYEKAEVILGDPGHGEFGALRRELQWARLVYVARSFDEWAASLVDRSGRSSWTI